MSTSRDPHEFLGDVAAKMINLATHSEVGNLYVAYALGYVIDTLSDVPEDDPAREFAEATMMGIVQTLTYVQAVTPEESIEEQAAQFRAMLDIATPDAGDHNEEEPNHG